VVPVFGAPMCRYRVGRPGIEDSLRGAVCATF
jgi:hypothetical protein